MRPRQQAAGLHSSSSPSSPTSVAPRSIRASARLDLLLPGGPRSRARVRQWPRRWPDAPVAWPAGRTAHV
jgi:hypothetical protein